jgi:hypothetical protein
MKAEDYRNVARYLQYLEAALMIDGVCGHILLNYPEAPIFPVHDCIYTIKRYLPLLEAVITDVWGAVGLRPFLREA